MRRRWLIPIAAVCVAAILLPVAAKQYRDYQADFAKRFPEATEVDLGYSPPARLAALLIVGPAVLVPRGFFASDLNIVTAAGSLTAVFLFWCLLLYLTARQPTQTVWRSCLRAIGAAIAIAVGYHAAYRFVGQTTQLSWPMFREALRIYGMANVLWVECCTAVWIFGVAGMLITQTILELRRAENRGFSAYLPTLLLAASVCFFYYAGWHW